MNLKLLRDRIDQMAAVNWTDVGQRQEAYQHFLRNKTAHRFWTELFGEFELSKKYLLYWNLSRVLEPLRQDPSAGLGMGLMFPLLSKQGDTNYDIAFWFDLVSRILKQETKVSAMFWNRYSIQRPPCMAAYLSPPSPRSVSFLLRPDLRADGEFELAPETDEALERILLRVGNSRRKLLQNGE